MNNESTLNERTIIELIRNRLDLMPNMPVPFGDDVSAYVLGDDRLAVLKTDMLVDLTDVPPGMTLWQASRKAVVMNVSDFAAKGVQPLAILVSLGLPSSMTLHEVQEVADGLNAGAREYGAYILGGDVNECSDLVISLSLFGISEKKRLIPRSGAKKGDIVAVTGLFGLSASGLKILLEQKKVPKDIRSKLIAAVLMPQARLKEGLALSKTGKLTASIDSSDGLAWSLYEIARASKVGFRIHEFPIPTEVKHFAALYNLDLWELVLYGGEEYELVITLNKDAWNEIQTSIEKLGGSLIQIGTVISEQEMYLDFGNQRLPIQPRGWNHFKRSKLI